MNKLPTISSTSSTSSTSLAHDNYSCKFCQDYLAFKTKREMKSDRSRDRYAYEKRIREYETVLCESAEYVYSKFNERFPLNPNWLGIIIGEEQIKRKEKEETTL